MQLYGTNTSVVFVLLVTTANAQKKQTNKKKLNRKTRQSKSGKQGNASSVWCENTETQFLKAL